MSQEILYTSAPQGLKPGSRGFCTVQSTAGMAKNLAERLESLSGYRHAFAPHSADASRNPVNYSHLVLTVGGRKYHVLSRIGDAGLDYTHRSNKLAHHVALDPEELTPAGPAWTLAQPEFCIAAWDGETKILTAGRQPTPTLPEAGVCRRWKEVTGDAGWAGVLAENAIQPQPRPISVIFQPGMPTLWLVVEAMHLLPPERRRDVTFSTYFTKLPAGVDCQWRFVLDGTPEARSVRRNPHAAQIDLCANLGKAVGGSLVDAARNGTPEPWQLATSIDVPAAPPVPRPAKVSACHEPAIAAQPQTAQSSTQTTPSHVPPPTPLSRLAPPANEALRRRLDRKSRVRGKTLAVVAGVCMLVTGGLFAAYYAGTQNGRPIPRPDSAPNENDRLLAADLEQHRDESNRRDMQQHIAPEQQSSDPPETREQDASRQSTHAEQATTKSRPQAESPPERVADPPPPRPQPLSEVRRLAGLLQLPPRKDGIDGGNQPVELTKLFIDAETPCELEIVGSDVLLGPGREFVVQQPSQDADVVRTWNVVLKIANSIAANPKVATFHWRDDSLSFQWEKQAVSSLQTAPLKYCLLRIRAGGETELCRLSEPESVEPAVIDFSVRRQPVEVPLPVDGSVAAKHLRFDVGVVGYPHDVELVRSRALGATQSGRIRLFEPGPRRSLNAPFLELDVKLENDEERTRLLQTVDFARETGGRFVSTPKSSLAREWFEEIAREAASEQKQLAGLSEEIGGLLADAERKLDEVKAKAAVILKRAPQKPDDYATEKQKLDYNRRLQMLERELLPVREQAAKAQQEAVLLGKAQQDCRGKIAAWKGVRAFADTKLARLDEVEAKLRIHYRFYVTIGKREVELLRTDGGVF